MGNSIAVPPPGCMGSWPGQVSMAKESVAAGGNGVGTAVASHGALRARLDVPAAKRFKAEADAMVAKLQTQLNQLPEGSRSPGHPTARAIPMGMATARLATIRSGIEM